MTFAWQQLDWDPCPPCPHSILHAEAVIILFIFYYRVCVGGGGVGSGIKRHQMIILQFNSECYPSAKLISSQEGNCKGKVDMGRQICAQTHIHSHTHTHKLKWLFTSLNPDLHGNIWSSCRPLFSPWRRQSQGCVARRLEAVCQFHSSDCPQAPSMCTHTQTHTHARQHDWSLYKGPSVRNY